MPSATRFLASSTDGGPLSVRAAAALFGAPLDITETFRSGTHGGPSAVRSMSDSLESYSPELDRSLDDVTFVDLGDLPLAGLRMAEALDSIADAMAHAASIATLGVMVGGEHTGSLGGYRGLKRLFPDAVLLQLDAHLDIREQYDGEALTHASWLYHAGQEFGFEDIFQLGLRSGEREEWRLSRARAALSSMQLDLPASARERIGSRPAYLSVDIDVLDPSHAPGTGCPEPGGVTFRELAAFLHGLRGLRVVGLDVMEVAPNLDPANITAAAAAKIIRDAVLAFGGDLAV